MSTGPKPKRENRGGHRAGSGRKAMSVSELIVKKMSVAAKRRAKETGKEIHDVLLDIIYDSEEATRDRLTAAKLWHNAVLVKRTEKDVHLNTGADDGPGILLPAIKEDPAKLMVIEGGKV